MSHKTWRNLGFSLVVVTALFVAVQAKAATLTLTPSSTSVVAGQTVNIDVMLDTQGEAIDGVDLYYLRYNPSILQIQDANSSTAGVQITAGTLLSVTLTNSVNTSSGLISFSQVTSGGSTYSGSGKLATITFKGLYNGTSSASIDFTAGSTSDSNVAGGGVDKLSSVGNSSITVTGGNPTPPPPPPPPPTPTPTPSPAPTPDKYPDGLVFKYPNSPTCYVLEGGIARPITDITVLQNNVSNTRPIATIPESVTFTSGAVLGLKSGTLIRSSADPTVYLIVDSQKRPFFSESEFKNYGYSFNQVNTVNDVNLINTYPTTNQDFVRPFGTVFKYANSPAIYFLNSARQKRPYTSFNVFRLWVNDPKIVVTVPDTETYPDGAPATLPNGTLVKGSGSGIYLVFDGKLRPFASVESLTNLGFNFNNVVNISDGDLSMHPMGEIMQ